MQKKLILLSGVISLIMPNLFSSEGNNNNISSYHFIERTANLNRAFNAVQNILIQKSLKWECLKPNVDVVLSYINRKDNDLAFNNCAVKVWGDVSYKYSADVWNSYFFEPSLGKEIIKIQGYNMRRQIRNNADTTWKYLEDMIPEIQ